MDEERRKAQGGFLLLDSGNLFVSKSRKSCEQKELGKADLILKSYQSMAYDVINLSQSDLALGVPFLLKKAKNMKLPFLSSNLVKNGNDKSVFDSTIVKKIDDLNVGIFGLMDLPKQGQKSANYKVKPPYNTARKMVNFLKDKADLIIALSSLSKEMNVKLLKNIEGLDFIISTDRRTHTPIKINDGYIVSSGNKGKYLGCLNINLKSLNRPLELKDISRKGKLNSNISWLEQRIKKLDDKKEDILKSDNPHIKDRFIKELERLKKQKGQNLKELAGLNNVHNHFDNKIIPLAAKKSGDNIILSRKNKVRTGMASQPGSPMSPIKINAIKNEKENKISFIMAIDKAPNQVRALGFDVVYDPQVLKYSGYTRGELVKNFDMFDASQLREGQLRVGGFEARENLILPGKSGTLVKLNFQIIGKGVQDVQLTSLKDDISSWGVEKIQLPSKKQKGNEGELKKIQEAITKKGAKWEAGDTSVSDLSPDEKKKRLGLKKKARKLVPERDSKIKGGSLR